MKKTVPSINDRWSPEFKSFVKKCLTKDPKQRPTATELLKDPFVANSEKCQNEFAEAVKGFMAMKRQQQMFL